MHREMSPELAGLGSDGEPLFLDVRESHEVETRRGAGGGQPALAPAGSAVIGDPLRCRSGDDVRQRQPVVGRRRRDTAPSRSVSA